MGHRHPIYLISRLDAVAHRYGPTSAKAKERIRRCMRGLTSLPPTFATPGRVVEADPAFFRELCEAGAELAIHGYDHVDFRRLSPAQGRWQFERAIEAYARAGLPFTGFRCPYLSYDDAVRPLVPPGVFSYSSNRAIAWPAAGGTAESGPVYAQLARNYRAVPAETSVCTPSLDDGLVEIPASVPDDLQLCDGLGLGAAGLLEVLLETLAHAHRREELFAPLFHPEAFDLLREPFEALVADAGARTPRVWLTQLRDVAGWWRERAEFTFAASPTATGLEIELHCSPRATVLARGLDGSVGARAWSGRWSVLERRRVTAPDGVRPFVGVSGVDGGTAQFLREQGYLLDDGPDAARCAVQLTASSVAALGSQRALLDHLEAGTEPLLRFSRWPGEAKSALCLAGDLDALSVWNYVERLRPSVRARSRYARGAPA